MNDIISDKPSCHPDSHFRPIKFIARTTGDGLKEGCTYMNPKVLICDACMKKECK